MANSKKTEQPNKDKDMTAHPAPRRRMIWALWGFLALVATSCGAVVSDNFSDATEALSSDDEAAAEFVSE